MPAHGGVDHGMVEHVADVQRAGDVGRRDNDGEDAAGRLRIGVEDAGFDPPLGPVRLEALRLVCFFQFHEKLPV